MYLILIVLLTLYLIPLIDYRIKEYRNENIRELNIGQEKGYKPKFSFKKGVNYEYLEVEVSSPELQHLKVGMTAAKEAGKDSINIDNVCISLFQNHTSNYRVRQRV